MRSIGKEILIMAKCEICGKVNHRASKLSYRSSQLTKRTLIHQQPNVQKTTIMVDGVPTKKHVCTKCLKTLNKD